jgi:hypothetical protein
MVCLWNGSDLYERRITGALGTAVFDVSTASPDSVRLTVTALNHTHFQTDIPVVYSGVALDAIASTVVDGGDGMANPGESIDLEVTVKNFGTLGAEGVQGKLTCGGSDATITDSTAYFGAVGAGGEVTGAGGFTLQVDGSLEDRRAIVLNLTLTDTSAVERTCEVPLLVAAPVVEVLSHGVDDGLGGDGDGLVEAGETCLLTLELLNRGLMESSVSASITSLDAYLTVADSVAGAGPVAGDGKGYTIHTVELQRTALSMLLLSEILDMQSAASNLISSRRGNRKDTVKCRIYPNICPDVTQRMLVKRQTS